MGSDEIHIAQLPRPGETLEGRYRLGKPFASGGMGVIMRAEQLRTGRDVAVKLLHPHIAAQKGFADRFKREVRVATLFDHQHIMRVYDVGQTPDGVLYLVMEYLEGEELKALIAREAPLSVGRAGDIALQMLDGLAEAHSMNVVHRDFKPSNVFITKTRRGDDHIKLLDFGIAKVINSQQPEITSTGEITGTPSYIAPETLLKQGKRDKKVVDVYAAGLVLLEMLTGQKSFQGEDITQTLLMQLKKPVRIPKPIDNTLLGSVIKKATTKHPGDRYRDADEMFEALEVALKQAPHDLRLEPDDIPGQTPNTSPSLLEQIAGQDSDTNLEMLRDAPQHESYTGRPTEDASEKRTKKVAAVEKPGGDDRATRAVDPPPSLLDKSRPTSGTISLEPDEVEIVDAADGTTLAEQTDRDDLGETEEVPQALQSGERPGYASAAAPDEVVLDEETAEVRQDTETEAVAHDQPTEETPGPSVDPSDERQTDESAPREWGDPNVELDAETNEVRRAPSTDEGSDEVPERPAPAPPSREFQPPPGTVGRREPQQTAPPEVTSDTGMLQDRRTLIWAAGGIVVAMLVGLGGWALFQPEDEPSQERTAAEDTGSDSADVTSEVVQADVGRDADATAPDAPQTTSFVLQVEPHDARVTGPDGEELGAGEVTVELTDEQLPRTLSIGLDGYEDREVELTRNGPREIDIELEEEARERSRPTRSTSSRPSGSRTRTGGSNRDRSSSGSSPRDAPRDDETGNESDPEDIDKMVDEFLPDG